MTVAGRAASAHRRATALAGLCAAVSLGLSCGGDSKTAIADVTGVWRFEVLAAGADDADIAYLELRQAGSTLSGNTCTCRGAACSVELTCDGASIAGLIEGSEVSFDFEFSEDGATYTTEMTLRVLPDGSLSGAGTSTKCGCEFEATATAFEEVGT